MRYPQDSAKFWLQGAGGVAALAGGDESKIAGKVANKPGGSHVFLYAQPPNPRQAFAPLLVHTAPSLHAPPIPISLSLSLSIASNNQTQPA